MQPDTLIPDLSNPQSWNRYSYVGNNPIRNNDPTGHIQENDDDGGIGPTPPIPPVKPLSGYTPGDILDDFLDNGGGLGGPTNQTIEAVNNYITDHPNYNASTDPYLHGQALTMFSGIREEYWRGRAIEAGLCKVCIGEAANLYAYYDMHQKVILTGWDSSRVNWRNVGFDVLGTAASFIALNDVAQALKISDTAKDVAAVGAALNGIRSGSDAYGHNDGPGLALTVGGFIPGPVGGVASAGSVFKDLAEGIYTYTWTPSIPR